MNLDPPYVLWSIWHQSSALWLWLLYALCVLCLYAGFCVVSTISRLRSIRHLGASDLVTRRTVVVLRNRCAALPYAILAEFYLFGVVLFMSFQFVGQFVMGSDVARKILAQFVLDSALATNVFAVLLILHLAQWFVSTRVSRYCDIPSRGGHSATE
jgi:hypothetical protein